MARKAVVMDEGALNRSLTRISHEIIEKNPNEKEICVVGIYRRGVPLAEKIAENIKNFSDIKPLVGSLDITLYRDDLSEVSSSPILNETKIDFSIEKKVVILVDDVIYTGRTTRAALDAVIALGRPSKIQLAVLIDRGHREFPIKGDYIGKNLPTSHEERVRVLLPPFDNETKVEIWDK